MKKLISIFPILFFLVVLYFYKPFFLEQKLPIPSDTIVGLYHPFRDLYEKDYPRGIPFKNFLVTDPVRQTLIWKELSIDQIKSWNLPLWNPYEMAGKPLLGNFQSSPFYPLNIILLIKPFYFSWSIFIILQTLLGGIFMFFYLRSLKLTSASSVFGSLAFSFSGFSVAWLEWGNVIHTALWLPLILLSIDKIVSSSKYQVLSIKNIWGLVFLFALSSSFFAGHLQTFFYMFGLAIIYIALRLFLHKKIFKIFSAFFIFTVLFLILTSIQWYQTFLFILNSSRSIDQSFLQSEGWFLPWQNLIQFVIPDFFGNPATLNYWGVWNYAEFVGYIGLIPILFSLIAVIFIKRKIIYFFSGIVLISILLMTNNFISQIPYRLEIPLLSTAQPTRIIFLVVFSLSILAAFGINYLQSESLGKKIKKLLPILVLPIFLFAAVWISLSANLFNMDLVDRQIAIRNSILPSLLLFSGIIFILLSLYLRRKRFSQIILMLFILITAFDLLRFADKFTPFTDKSYLFPNTKIISFLASEAKNETFRIASLNDEILPPNFPTHYKLQSVSGYDPLYLKSYAEFIAALERGEANISPPFGFNRIITPKNYNSPLFNLLNVKYVLSFDDITSENYEFVMQEGKTKLFENKLSLPRVFFVRNVIDINDRESHIEMMFKNNLSETAVVFSENDNLSGEYSAGKTAIVSYLANYIEMSTENDGEGFLVFLDTFYPFWEAKIDGINAKIYRTDYTFRGIKVPKGNHVIIFKPRII